MIRRRARPARLPCAVVAAALLASLLAAPTARAAPTASCPTIALEVHVGPRSAEAAAALAPVLDELERRGFAARGDTIATVIGDHAPRPGVLDRGKTVAQLVRLVDSGLEQFTTGSFREARAILTSAVQQLRRNPAVVVVDPAGPDAMFRALVGLALSQARLGDAAASVAAMTELIRAFPAQPVGRAQHGPEAERLYQAVRTKTRATPRGRLAITASAPDVQIFVDHRLRGTGKAALVDLLPGTYHVLAQAPGSEGRQYALALGAGDDAVLEIDWPIESALTISEPWAGFVFATDAARARAITDAATLARRWRCDAVALVETSRVRGEPALTGTLVASSGNVVRTGTVAIGRDDTTRRALAHFLVDATPAPEITTGAPPAPSRELPRARSSLAAKLVLGAGLVGLTTGVVLVAVDQDDGNRDAQGRLTSHYRDTAPLGLASGAVGLAAIGVGLWLLLHDEHAPSGPTLSIAPAAASISWTGRF